MDPFGTVYSASALAANPYAAAGAVQPASAASTPSTPGWFSQTFSDSGTVFGPGGVLGPQNTPSAFNTAASAVGTSTSFIGDLAQGTTWQRVGLVVLGIIMIMMALFIFGISSIERVPVVGAAAKAAAAVA